MKSADMVPGSPFESRCRVSQRLTIIVDTEIVPEEQKEDYYIFET